MLMKNLKKKPVTELDMNAFKFADKMSFLKAYTQNDSITRQYENNHLNLSEKKLCLTLENPEFVITEKDLEDCEDDGDEKIVFIEIDKNNTSNKFICKRNKDVSTTINEQQQERESSYKIPKTCKKSSNELSSSSIKNELTTNDILKLTSPVVETSHIQQHPTKKVVVSLKRHYRNCSTLQNNAEIINLGILSDKKKCLQRSATRDAAETMLRLDTGVPLSSVKNSLNKHQLKSKDWIEEFHKTAKKNVNIIQRTTATEYNMNEYQDMREKLKQAADSDEDVKFCEWIISNFKKMTNTRKSDVKKAITKILLD